MSDTARIHTKLTADGSELTRALGQGITKAADFKGQMKNLGATIGGAFTAVAVAGFIRSAAQAADGIADVASSLGLSTDELQSFDASARMTQGGVDGMRMAIKKLVEVQAQAQDGDAAAAAKIDRLGLGTRGLTASTGELVKAAADHYKSTGDLAGIYDLFGRQAVNVRDVFDEISSKSLPDFIAAQQEAGMVVESSMIGTLAHTNDLLDAYSAKLQNWKMAFVGGVVRGVEQIGAMIDGDARPLEEINRKPDRQNALEKELAARREMTVEQKVALQAQKQMIEQMNAAGRAAIALKKDQSEAFAEIMKGYELGLAATPPSSPDAQRNYSQLRSMGLAANDVGAAREKKSQEDKMISLEEKQLVALKELKGAVEKITGAKL